MYSTQALTSFSLFCFLYISSVQSLSLVQLFATPWISARQASLSITNSRSSPKLMCIESVMPSSHLILCRPLLLLLPIPPSIRVFSNESALRMRWPKYWSFRLSISPSNEHPGLVSICWTGWISLQFKYISSQMRNWWHDNGPLNLRFPLMPLSVEGCYQLVNIWREAKWGECSASLTIGIGRPCLALVLSKPVGTDVWKTRKLPLLPRYSCAVSLSTEFPWSLFGNHKTLLSTGVSSWLQPSWIILDF